MGDKSGHNKPPVTYAEAGVDIEAGNTLVERIAPLAKSTARTGADSDLGGFGGLFDLAACKFDDPVLVAANDGVGTKLKIAIESGIHDTVGIDLVAMCVNDLIVQGAEPLFFLDYFASSKLDVDAATDVIAGIAEGCRQANCALIGGETAEMPGMYAAGDYDLAGFSVGAVERRKILPRDDMAEGDVILGLTSNGLHSNGFSLVRKLVEHVGLAWDALSPANRKKSVAEDLLTPTRIYVQPCCKPCAPMRRLKGWCILPAAAFKKTCRACCPIIYRRISTCRRGICLKFSNGCKALAILRMLKCCAPFNCGIGMALIVSPDGLADVMAMLAAANETVIPIGTLAPRDGEAVTFSGSING